MRIEETVLQGCYQLHPDVMPDDRGRFIKTFHRETFARFGLATEWAETFHSVSKRGVLRGMHFQGPPYQNAKLVHCVNGRCFDAVLDLRRGSPTERQFATFILDAERCNQIYIPEGFAHGCYALTEDATILYQVTSVFSPEHDAGIRWDSAGIPWPDAAPLLSERDRAHPLLSEFESPFTMDTQARHGR